ncbi:MAG: hypothetical protein AAF919_10275 [Pseudomonadota bacterium]
MLISSPRALPLSIQAACAVLAFAMVPTAGLLLALPQLALPGLAGARPVLTTLANVGVLALFSPIVAWPGMVLLTPAAMVLSWARLAGYGSLAILGAAIGPPVALAMLTEWDIREFGGLLTFAAFGGLYGVTYGAVLAAADRLRARMTHDGADTL